jgi:hypothetical protein
MMQKGQTIYYNKKDICDSDNNVFLSSGSKFVLSGFFKDLEDIATTINIELMVLHDNKSESDFYLLDTLNNDNVIKDDKGRIVGFVAQNKKVRIFKDDIVTAAQVQEKTIDIFVEDTHNFFHENFIEEKNYKRINLINDIADD